MIKQTKNAYSHTKINYFCWVFLFWHVPRGRHGY